MTAESLPPARTYLFVPGTRPGTIRQGAGQRCRRGRARPRGRRGRRRQGRRPQRHRDMVASGIARGPVAHRGAHQRRRLALVRRRPCGAGATPRATGVLLPKAESADQIAATQAALPGASILALIESARGVAEVDRVAAAGVQRLVFGTLDFALDLDMDIAHRRLRPGLCGQPHRDRLARRRPAGAGRRRHAATRRRGTLAGRPGRGAPLRLRRQAVHPPDARCSRSTPRCARARRRSTGRAASWSPMPHRPAPPGSTAAWSTGPSCCRRNARWPWPATEPHSPTSRRRKRQAPWPPPSSTRASSATCSATRACATSGPTRTAPPSTSTSSAPWPRSRANSASSRRKRPTRSSRNCELSQIDWVKLKAKTEQIGYPDHRGGQPDQRQLPRQARRVLPLGRHHAGHHRHGRRAADARRPGAGRAGPGRDRRRAGRAGEEVPRHARHRPLQPAAGHADHLRLQDGQHPGGHRPSPRAPAATQAARADGRVRRRVGHAVLAGEGRDGNAGRPDEGTGPGPAADLLAHGARHHRRSRRLPRAWSAARSARSRWTSS